MSINRFDVIDPATSNEVVEMVKTALFDDEADFAVRGLLHLGLQAVDSGRPCGLEMRVRQQRFDRFGDLERILGSGVLTYTPELPQFSASVAIRLADEGHLPATATAVFRA